MQISVTVTLKGLSNSFAFRDTRENTETVICPNLHVCYFFYIDATLEQSLTINQTFHQNNFSCMQTTCWLCFVTFHLLLMHPYHYPKNVSFNLNSKFTHLHICCIWWSLDNETNNILFYTWQTHKGIRRTQLACTNKISKSENTSWHDQFPGACYSVTLTQSAGS